MREATARGAAIDIEDFERRLRNKSQSSGAQSDPLSELARLMQGDDAEQNAVAHRFDHILGPQPDPAYESAPADEVEFSEELRGSYEEDEELMESRYPEPPIRSAPPRPEPFRVGAPRPAQASPPQRPTVPAPGRPSAKPKPSGPAPVKDDWDDDPPSYLNYGGDDSPSEQEPTRKSRIRPWHAVTAALLVAAGGIGYGFAHRSGSIGFPDLATIAAPDGPTKVAPAAEGQAETDRPDATVLDRQETTPVRNVASNEEQAVDPTVDQRAAQAPLSQTMPRKVKTVSVRPDGSLMDGDLTPPAVAKAAASASSVDSRRVATTPPAAAKPAVTPKSDKPVARAKPALKPKALPRVAAAEPSDVEQLAQDPPAAKLEEAADTPPTPTKGSFAVQFAAPTSEAEARALMSQVAAKYGAQLGGRRVTFHEAQVGDKTVFRVRALGYSKEAAVSVCGKVKASGGNCFVAAN